VVLEPLEAVEIEQIDAVETHDGSPSKVKQVPAQCKPVLGTVGEMEQRTLGRSGVRVGAVGLGAMMFGRGGNPDEAECVRMVHRGLDAGVTLVDTADGYTGGDSERIVGQALRGARRDAAVIATKCFFPRGKDPNRRGGSRRWILKACDESLARLGTDRIDVYQLHRIDPRVDLEESLGALDDLVRAGKVLAVGTSGASPHDLVECQWRAAEAGLVRPVSEQSPYSIFVRGGERSTFPACLRHGVGVLVYGPLNGGWLSGKYRASEAPPAGSRAARSFYDARWWDRARPEVRRKLELLGALDVVARDCGRSLADVALAFTLAHPAVSCALVGPRTPEQFEASLAAADLRLDGDVLDRIDALVAPGTDVDPSDLVVVDGALDVANRRRP
jgi:aryl-alcohol dehydrogenase-like predicted oxidoreductase